MIHIKVSQEITSSENVNKNIISKLYDIFSENLNLDNESILKGRIDSNYIYDIEFDYFINKFNNFIINYNVEKIIKFKDPLVETIFKNNNIYDINADAITYSCASSKTNQLPYIFKTTNITSFDELKLFNYTYAQWGYWETGAFSNCINLTSIDLNKFTEISNAMFAGCINLKTIKNFNGNYLGFNALSGCTNLESVNLSNVKNLDQGQFNNCTKLNLIENGYDFTKIEIVDYPANAYKGITGSFEANFTSLRRNNQNSCNIKFAFTNTPGVTAIYGNEYFNSISGYNSNWEGYVDSCINLIKIDFSMCTSVTKVIRHLCRRCINLKIIKLPPSIEKIYYAPFGWNNDSNFPAIKAIYFPVVTPPLIYNTNDCTGNPSNSFHAPNSFAQDLKIYVPSESISTYENTDGWSAFTGKYYSLEEFTTDYPND